MSAPEPPPRLSRVARRLAPSLIVLSLLINLLLLVSAIYMLQVYDRVLASGSLDTLLWLTVAALVALATYGVLEHSRKLILGRTSYWLELQLSGPVLRRAMTARLAGDPSQPSLRDVSDVQSFVGGEGLLAFLDAPWTPIFIGFIWLVHPSLGMLAALGALLLFLGALANDLLTRKAQQETSAELRRNQASAQRYVESAETVLPLGMAAAIVERWRSRQGELRSVQQRLFERTSGILCFSRAFRLALQVLILALGAYHVLQGDLTAGGMIAASIILGRALAPIERSIGAWRQFIAARSGYCNLRDMLKADGTTADPVRLPRPAGRLSVEDVSCFAPRSRRAILEDLSFALDPGQACAVVGPSGSGKSSLCRVLVGAWRPARGHVRIDGADVAAWPSERLGPYIGYLPQEVELFPGTVAQNIARMGEVDSEAVIAAARLAGVHELILRLPNGYEMDVGAQGTRISLGQRQRLALARALYGDPALVVLDEPNSNLDSEGDAALMRALSHLKEAGRTVLIVTHQPAALRAADQILLLRDGRLAGFGARDDVMRIRRQVSPAVVASSGGDASRAADQAQAE